MPQPRAIVPDSGAIRACLNNTGSDIPKYRLLKKAPTVVDAVVLATDGTDIIYAASMGIITNGYTGDGQVEGRALVEAGGAINVGQKVTGGAAGKAVVAGAGVHIYGQAASAALVDGDIIEVDVIRSTG